MVSQPRLLLSIYLPCPSHWIPPDTGFLSRVPEPRAQYHFLPKLSLERGQLCMLPATVVGAHFQRFLWNSGFSKHSRSRKWAKK